MAGRLVLVVGPSGVGKDSVMSGARERLASDGRVVFPRRMVTRPAEAGGEDHDSADPATFSALQAAGAFALAWSAHGLSYGIPAAIHADLVSGRTVVVNVSRAVIEQARRDYPGLLVITIVAPPAEIRRRLLARGRESEADIETRLARAEAFTVSGPDVAVVVNDGALADAVDTFVRLVQPPSA
jgi:ribose 1,5-bisphosphokinase